MIDIDTAIKESKNKENVSDGGSACFDFGDAVLVKYTCPTKYLKDGEHTREKSEEIMESINNKANNGVNTPKHLAVRRVIEGDDDVCYVLQQKCPGRNCNSISKNGVSFDEGCESLKFVLNIPYEHYKKLIEDGLALYEMGHEAKNKNLFYDSNSGFWFIDFIANNKDDKFDPTDKEKVFMALRYVVPKPIRISSSINYNIKSSLTDDQKQIKNELEYAIKAKTLSAIKEVLPDFEKTEKFFLLDEDDGYKNYLMKNGFVKKDLINIESEDYIVFKELYEIVIKGLIDKIVNKGIPFWSIECNDIRNDSNLFNLQLFFKNSKLNTASESEYEDSYDYDYDYAVRKIYTRKVLEDVVNQLKQLEPNDNINKFLVDLNAANSKGKSIN